MSHPGKGIALLDVGTLLRAIRSSQGRGGLKADIARAKIDLKNAGGELQAEGEEVAKLPVGSPQRSGRQSQVSRRMADLQVHLQGHHDQFVKRQSKVYSKFFQKIHVWWMPMRRPIS